MMGMFTTVLTQAQDKSIKKIIDNPGQYLNERVEIFGLLTKYVPAGTSSTAYYILQGDYGDQIKVITAGEAPETNKKYHVTGILSKQYDELIVTETSKTPEETKENVTAQPQIQQPVVIPPPVEEKQSGPDILIIVIIAGVIILAALIIILLVRQKKPDTISSTPPKEDDYKSPPTIPIKQFNDFSTIKYTPESSKTMKFIPGKLEIISGEDKGKSFKIAGYPTREGSVVSIGRAKVSGDRAYAHIQIDEKFQTVSRKQAELIYVDNHLFVSNLSESSFTQLDGLELKLNEKAEVKPNSVIRMAELEFRYSV